MVIQTAVKQSANIHNKGNIVIPAMKGLFVFTNFFILSKVSLIVF